MAPSEVRGRAKICKMVTEGVAAKRNSAENSGKSE